MVLGFVGWTTHAKHSSSNNSMKGCLRVTMQILRAEHKDTSTWTAYQARIACAATTPTDRLLS
jgi:hypothetical protein